MDVASSIEASSIEPRRSPIACRAYLLDLARGARLGDHALGDTAGAADDARGRGGGAARVGVAGRELRGAGGGDRGDGESAHVVGGASGTARTMCRRVASRFLDKLFDAF